MDEDIVEELRFELGGLTWTDAVWEVLEHNTDLLSGSPGSIFGKR